MNGLTPFKIDEFQLDRFESDSFNNSSPISDNSNFEAIKINSGNLGRNSILIGYTEALHKYNRGKVFNYRAVNFLAVLLVGLFSVMLRE